jgi:hypothetical protein
MFHKAVMVLPPGGTALFIAAACQTILAVAFTDFAAASVTVSGPQRLVSRISCGLRVAARCLLM